MTRSTISSVSLAFLLSSSLVGCDKPADSEAKSDAKSADSKDGKAGDAAPTEKDAKELFTSKVPELPGPLAKLTFGSTTEDVKKAAP